MEPIQFTIGAALVLSQVTDLLSTDYAIHHGCVEKNPLMRKRSVRYAVKSLVGALMATAFCVLPVTWGSVSIFSLIALGVFAVSFHNYMLAWQRRQALVRRLDALMQ